MCMKIIYEYYRIKTLSNKRWDIMQDVCDLTKKLWRIYYMSKCEDCIEDLFPYIDEQCVIVGTGKYEYYHSKKKFVRHY